MNLKREQEFVSQYHFDARNFEWENENGAPETKVDVNFQLIQHDQENQVTSLIVVLSFMIVFDKFCHQWNHFTGEPYRWSYC